MNGLLETILLVFLPFSSDDVRLTFLRLIEQAAEYLLLVLRMLPVVIIISFFKHEALFVIVILVLGILLQWLLVLLTAGADAASVALLDAEFADTEFIQPDKQGQYGTEGCAYQRVLLTDHILRNLYLFNRHAAFLAIIRREFGSRAFPLIVELYINLALLKQLFLACCQDTATCIWKF